jgi:hypothetical protein
MKYEIAAFESRTFREFVLIHCPLETLLTVNVILNMQLAVDGIVHLFTGALD